MGKKKMRQGSTSVIKRLVGNRNTVTFLGILACVVTLIVGYNIRVKNAISPISVPYARVSIPSRTLITGDMIGRIKISSSYVNDSTNLIRNANDVVNKYSSYKTGIPQGSLFYRENVMEREEMPDSAFANLEDNTTIFSLDVSVAETFGNEIRAGDYIDLYLATKDPDRDNKAIYGKFIESIRVLAVKDSSGNNIIRNTLAYGRPSELLFAVDNDLFELLMSAQYLNINIVPFIRNHKYTEAANETKITYEELERFITDRMADHLLY